MPKPGERTKISEYVSVKYYPERDWIIVYDEYNDRTIELDATARAKFDAWRAELDKDIELRKAAGF